MQQSHLFHKNLHLEDLGALNERPRAIDNRP